MGKPFDLEIEQLPATYTWALNHPIDMLTRSVARLQGAPLLAVGSGGSLTACHFAAHLHGLFAHQPAQAISPLQAVSSRIPSSAHSVLIPTAGGNNPDVVGAVRLLAESEPKCLLVLCGNRDSKVASLAKRFEIIELSIFDLPFGKDGFLATNSLLTFCVLLARAYSAVNGQAHGLPKSLHGFFNHRRAFTHSVTSDRRFQALLERQTLVVLHGPATMSAAVDVESKFTESALGQVQICDFRQFAHGRHHWLAKRAAESAVLSLESLDDVSVASQTLELLPPGIPIERISVKHNGWHADLAGICEGFVLTGTAGRLKGIDPGRPGVPAFGRRLYHANAFAKQTSSKSLSPWKIRAIERKAFQSVDRLVAEDRFAFWQTALGATLDELTQARFVGLVVDYDGTLCNEDERFDPLPKDTKEALETLLERGMRFGVATGRGKSVRESLQQAFPKRLWPQIVVGYYNGGTILRLDDPDVPDGSDSVGADLKELATALREDGLLAQGKITLRSRQITLSDVRGVSLQALCDHAEAISNRLAAERVRVMRSGHSVDLVPHSVSKLAVVAAVRELSGATADAPVIRIGDRGQWPGNDAQLLASPHGLSVHEVSSDPNACWNLGLAGHRGRQATVRHLMQLKVSTRGIRLQLS